MVIAVAALIAGAVAPRLSRADFELTPVIGMMNPVNEDALNLVTPLIIQRTSAVAGGGRLTWWARPRLGIEGSVVVAGAQLQVTGNAFLVSSGSVTMADARLRLRVTPSTAPVQFDVIGGAGLSRARWGIQHFLESAGLSFRSKTTAVAGIGLTAPVFANAALRFDVEDHIHASHAVVDQTLLPDVRTKQQNDILWTVGVVLPLSKH
jgi:hypothetical protein